MSTALKVDGDFVSAPRGNPTDEPVLKVLRGRPSPSELAAIVGVIAALPREEDAAETGPGRRRAAWSNPGLRLRVRRTWREAAVPARKGMDR